MNWKKNIIIIAIFLGVFPLISFGENENQEICVTCGSSPGNLIQINNFTIEMLSSIKTVGTEGYYAGKYVPPSRFDSGKFLAPKKNIVSKSLKRARESIESILSIQRIHLELSDLANIGDSLVVQSKNNAIRRDREKLNKIEAIINKKKYEISIGGGRTDKIGGATMDKLQFIIKKYKEKGILLDITTIEDSADYGSLILLLGKLNSALKHLVALNTENRAESKLELGSNTSNIKKIFNIGAYGEIIIKLNEESIAEIQKDYECTKRYACEDIKKETSNELKKARETIKNGGTNFIQEIKTTSQKFKKAYFSQNFINTFTNNTAINNLSGMINKIGNQRKVAKSETKPIETNNGKNLNQIGDSFQTENTKTQFTNKLINIQTEIITEANIMKEKYETTKTDDVMIYFVALSQQINGITKNILGSKQNENSLIKNLGLLCEKQCSNIISKRCYY